MEHGVLSWLCRQFGLPATAGGLITTGGSLATLAAVVAARHDRLGEDFTGGTLYVTAHTHHCVAKAARVAGLPAAAVRVVPTTGDLRMDTAAAAAMIEADRAAGRRPFLLVATAGSTDTGTVDPLPGLSELAARERLWFHVDAAYGGFFQLTTRGRAALTGIGAADSVVLDPHKGMFLAYGTGVLLVADTAPLREAHSGQAHYLQDIDGGHLPVAGCGRPGQSAAAGADQRNGAGVPVLHPHRWPVHAAAVHPVGAHARRARGRGALDHSSAGPGGGPGWALAARAGP
jgi:aromatic-L-amino-acid/L-tryptophan decarboxylase